jgi:ubiquinone/menaquinone biosynthesis C-methylase UbiE
MKIKLAKRLRCPECGVEGLDPQPFKISRPGWMEHGILVCKRCEAWYPVTGHVADLLPKAHAFPGTRGSFYERNRDRFQGSGREQPATSSPDPAFAAQVHQREHFDDLARRGDRFSYDALGRMPFQRASRDLMFEEWTPRIQPGSVVLDIGCADGLSTFDIARHDVEVIGLDISPEQIRRAQSRAADAGVENVTFVIGDADALPVADDTIDCVLCFGSLHHVPNPTRTLAEMARVLRVGGSYLGMENNATPLRPLFDALMRVRPIWLEEAGPEAQMSADDLGGWAEQAGLQVDSHAAVFVPPQLCNLLGRRAARVLLRLTDWVFGHLPVLRRWGGLIVIAGEKPQPRGAAAAQMTPRAKAVSAATAPNDNSHHSPSTHRPSPEQPSLPEVRS